MNSHHQIKCVEVSLRVTWFEAIEHEHEDKYAYMREVTYTRANC